MEVKRIAAENFRGIKHVDLLINGDVDYYAHNECGKTTIVDIFYWVLFGTNSAGKTKFGIKPINHETDLTEATVELDGIVLKKTYRDRITKPKKRGDKEKVTGIYKYYINDLRDKFDIKKSEYEAAVSKLVDITIFPLISNPMHFTGLKWDKQRSYLFEIAGFDKTSMDTHAREIKNLESSYNEIKDKLHDIDVQKKENEGNKPVLELDMSKKEIELEIDSTKKKIADLTSNEGKLEILKVEGQIEVENEKHKLRNEKINNEIKQLSEVLEHKKREQTSKLDLKIQKLEQQINFKKNTELSNANNALKDMQDRSVNISRDIINTETTIQSKLSEYNRISTEKFEKLETELCSMCGQKIPQENIEKAEKMWNETKTTTLNKIVEDGKILRNQVAELKKTLANLGVEKGKMNKLIQTLAEEVVSLDDELKSVQNEKKAIKPDEKITKRLEELETQEIDRTKLDQLNQKLEKLEAVDNNGEADTEELETTLVVLQEELENIKKIADIDKRIKELNKESKDLLKKEEQYLEEIDIAREQMTEHCRELETIVNKKFKLVKFKLFEMQKNGEPKDTCVCMINNVPYQELNSAGKIYAGIDIINTFSDFYDTVVPLFIDNSESITYDPFETKAQQIRLHAKRHALIDGVELFETKDFN